MVNAMVKQEFSWTRQNTTVTIKSLVKLLPGQGGVFLEMVKIRLGTSDQSVEMFRFIHWFWRRNGWCPR